MWIKKKTLYIFAGLIAGCLIEQGILRYENTQTMEANFAAETQGQGELEVYFDENFSSPLNLPTQDGQNLYSVKIPSSHLTTFRLNFKNSRNLGFAKIHSLTFTQGNEIRRIPMSEMEKWACFDCTEKLDPKNDVLTLSFTGKEPFITTSDLDIRFSTFLGLSMEGPILTTSVLVLFTLLSAFLSFQDVKALGVGLSILGAFLFIAPRMVRLIYSFSAASLPIRTAVGMSSMIGYPKILDLVSFFFLLLIAIVIGLSAGVLFGRRPLVFEKPTSTKILPFLFFVISFFAIRIAFTFPDLNAAVKAAKDTSFSVGFDASNTATWSYLAYKGYLPFRDFWFPYGGMLGEISNVPGSMFWTFVNGTVIQGVVALSIFILFSGNWLPAALLVLGIHSAECAGIVYTTRYFLSFGIVLGLVTIHFLPRRWLPWLFALWGTYIGWGVTRELNQLVYAAPAVLFYLFSTVHLLPTKKRLAYLKSVGIGLLVASAISVVYFLQLFYHGQLSYFFDFYLHMNDMRLGSSIPADLFKWVHLRPESQNLLLISLCFLLGCGTFSYFRIFRSKLNQADALSSVWMTCGLLMAMTYLKHIGRPHMANQILGISWFAACFTVFFWWKRMTSVQKSLFSVAFGVALWLSLGYAPVQNKLSEAPHVFANLGSELKLAADHATLAEANAAHFSLDHFNCVSKDCAQVKDFLSDLKSKEPGVKIYIMGIESYFYIVYGQKPPRFLSFYDGGGISAQHEMLHWLESEAPKYVVWNSLSDEFDGVPNTDKVPLIFDYVIKNYRPFRSMGGYQILRKAESAFSPKDLAFWSEKIKNPANLGHLPELSNKSELKVCPNAQDPDCEDFLDVRIDSPKEETVEIPILVDSKNFKITFQTSPHYRDYSIKLKRIWFWGTLKELGYHPTLVRQETPGVHFSIEQRVSDPEILY